MLPACCTINAVNVPRRIAAAFLFVLVATPVARPQNAAVPDQIELHRLRVVNRKDGAIQVSTDGGGSWSLIGRVTSPATAVSEGFLAANYAAPGTIAATAVHGLRIRTGGDDKTLSAPLLLSISPREYGGAVNKGFGGFVPRASGIVTDIAAGTSIFRNLAPYVGDAVFQQSALGGRLVPLPTTFKPRGQGEVLVLVVRQPATRSVTELVFENKTNGKVTARDNNGATQVVTTVLQPVKGVGRFDGTAYTGVGRINTNHCGTITVSTAPIDGALPEGEGRERRGGFQIHPAWHNSRTEEAGAPVVMVVGTPGQRKRELEGQAPLFKGAIPLAAMPTLPQREGGEEFGALVDVAIDDGPWEPMPAILGAQLNAFTGPGLTRWWKSQKIGRTARKGVTAFRLRLPLLTPPRSREVARAVAADYTRAGLAAARAGRMPLVQGVLTVNANPTNQASVSFVRLSIEGDPRGFTNVAPFTLSWDTTRVSDGDYLLELEALDADGAVIATTRRRVFVLNNPQAAPVSAATSASR